MMWKHLVPQRPRTQHRGRGAAAWRSHHRSPRQSQRCTHGKGKPMVGYFLGCPLGSLCRNHWRNLRGSAAGDQTLLEKGAGLTLRSGWTTLLPAVVPEQRSQPTPLPICRAKQGLPLGQGARWARLSDRTPVNGLCRPGLYQWAVLPHLGREANLQLGSTVEDSLQPSQARKPRLRTQAAAEPFSQAHLGRETSRQPRLTTEQSLWPHLARHPKHLHRVASELSLRPYSITEHNLSPCPGSDPVPSWLIAYSPAQWGGLDCDPAVPWRKVSKPTHLWDISGTSPDRRAQPANLPNSRPSAVVYLTVKPSLWPRPTVELEPVIGPDHRGPVHPRNAACSPASTQSSHSTIQLGRTAWDPTRLGEFWLFQVHCIST